MDVKNSSHQGHVAHVRIIVRFQMEAVRHHVLNHLHLRHHLKAVVGLWRMHVVANEVMFVFTNNKVCTTYSLD